MSQFLKYAYYVIAITICAGCHTAKDTGNISYEMFPQTCTLSNGKVVVVVAPRIGHIIGYHRVGEKNWLWLNAVPSGHRDTSGATEWINYGGDRVWMTPEAFWWPILNRPTADTTTDGGPMTVMYADSKKIVMKSRVSKPHGAYLTRTISLPDNDTTVRINNRIDRVADKKYPLHVWAITQVPLPDAAYLGLIKEQPSVKPAFTSPDEPKLTKDYALGAARFYWDGDKNTKVGTYGRWVAAVYKGTVFAQYASYDADGTYSDQANCEIFVDPKLKYMELELLSPTAYLQKSKSINLTVIWKLLDVPAGAQPQNIIRLIQDNSMKSVP